MWVCCNLTRRSLRCHGGLLRTPPYGYRVAMPNTIRRRGEGGTFAFTVCLADRRQRTLTDEIDLIKRAYAATARARPFDTLALCVLPDHLHAVWRLPDGDTNYSGRWQGFKRRVTHALGRRICLPRA